MKNEIKPLMFATINSGSPKSKLKINTIKNTDKYDLIRLKVKQSDLSNTTNIRYMVN